MPKRLFILTIYLLSLTNILAQTQTKDMTVEEYLAKFKDIAIREMERSGIPASITLAQGLHESAVGNGSLAKEANNHFGIKCTKDWKGESTLKWDDDPEKSCFRKYNNAEDSYVDHTDFLLNRKHYAFLFDYGRNSYKKWAYGLKKAGYATDPKYPEKLISAIQKYNLDAFDKELGPLFYTKDTASAHLAFLASGIKLKTKPRSFLFQTRKPMLYHENGSTYTVSRKGESLLAVAKRYNMNYHSLLKFNDMHDGDKLMDYQPVYINPKRSVYRGQDAFYKVENDVTMYELSQHYAIKLSSLLALNLLSHGEEPMNGEMIMLKEKALKKPTLRPANHIDTLPSPYIDEEEEDSTPVVTTVITTPIKTNPVSVVERPKPEPLELNTPTYATAVYADTARLNTSKSDDKAFLDIKITPGDAYDNISNNNNSTSFNNDNFLNPNSNSNNTVDPNTLFPNNNNNTYYPPKTDTVKVADNKITSPRINDNSTYSNNNSYNSNYDNSSNNSYNNFNNTYTNISTQDTNNNLSGNNNATTNNKNKTHIVQKGETLYRIFKLYNVPVEAIQKANQLKDTNIKEGDKLIIPEK